MLELACVVVATTFLGAGVARGATPVGACGAVITQPGHYFVPFDLQCTDTDPFGIGILFTEDVFLDLRGHTITGPGVAPAGNPDQPGIYVRSSSGVQIKHGTTRGFVFGVSLWDAHDTTVQQVTSRENLRIGLILLEGSNNTVVGNEFVHNGGGGLVVFPFPGPSVGNKIQDNVMSHNGFYGVYLQGEHNILRDNVMSLNGANAGPLNGGQGIWVVGSEHSTIQGNVTTENWTDGIILVDSSNNTLRGNTASENSLSGIVIFSSTPGAASANLVQGNTALGNNRDGVAAGVADLADLPECINQWKGNTFQTDWEGSMAGYGPGEGCIR